MTLTVKELIEKLNEYPEDYLVYTRGHFNDLSNVEYISDQEDLKRIYINTSKPEIKK
ncbi:MAG TPA: hypothetical protein PLQ70_10180 [Flavobacterium alvei]|mgnify:CR=1 FL=1|nr:hypothetical protein [Flavobacterium alvei]